jgi:hypothetical protein
LKWALLSSFLFLVSCSSNDLAAPDMPQVRFTELRVSNDTIQQGASITVDALIENKCNLVGFEWAASDGDIDGSEGRVTFTAPLHSAEVKISCTVSHPGREDVTKFILVKVR